jgi:hypothetical protein
MLIWINGPMGVGKTQIAHELHHRFLGSSFVCDPELLGLAIQRMLPSPMREEFQSFSLWRQGVRELAAHLAKGFDGVVLLPMTMLNEDHYDEIIGDLLSAGHDVRHFTLLASPETLLRRLRSRGDGRNSYGARRIDECLDALRRPKFAAHLHTDGLTIESIAEKVAADTKLCLAPSGNWMQRRARRLMVTLRHLRH